MSFFPTSFFLLPHELIEEIIIFSTLFGDARAPSTLAQTCRPLRTLVYDQRRHKRLWREIFLILFDDPRPARDVRAHGRALHLQQLDPSISEGLSRHDFPWQDEYKLRIWAESFILRRTRPPSLGSLCPNARSKPPTDAELYTVLDVLLRVILTAAPLPYYAVASIASHCHSLPQTHPIISPLLLAAHTQPTLVLGSHNTIWLARALAHGLPPVLMARLTALEETGEINIQKKPVKWDGLLVRLIAQVGLMTPIKGTERPNQAEVGHNDDDDRHDTLDQEGAHDRYDDDSDMESQHEDEGSEESDEETESDIGDEVGTAEKLATSYHEDDVLRLARIRVYNMAYPHRSRAFGPFLPLEAHFTSHSLPPAGQNLGPSAGVEDGPMSNITTMRLGSPSASVPPIPPIPDTNLDIESFDFSPFLDDDGENNNDETVGDRDVNVNVNENSNVVANGAPLISSVYPIQARSSSDTQGTHSPGIPDDQLLRFDWAWIAAARQVIELNLRNLLKSDRHQDVLRAFLSLEGLRSCSVPGFPPAAPEVDESEGEDGRTFRDGEGWDWAGVEGQWRRCVCWMEYSDLVGNNAKPLTERYSNLALSEVMRIFPFTLRIAQYSRAPASWPGRPKIHFEGEMYYGATPTQATTVGGAPNPDLRHMQGTVQMTASGEVCWSLVFYPEDRQSRWASDGVQIGGLGSAVGVIGMWTSAEHEPSAPIGPFWAWKVGPADACNAIGGRVS